MVNVWLDDMDHEQRPIPEGWLHVRTVEEAKHVLQTQQVQKLSLDHDLGACDICLQGSYRCSACPSRRVQKMTARLSKSKEVIELLLCLDCGSPGYEDWGTVMPHCTHFGTGYDLCLWMAEHGIWPAEKPTVHSMNPVGRQRMEGVIDRYFPEPAE